MISKNSLVDIISGQNNGIGAAAIRLMLWSLTPIYWAAVAIRNRKYTHRPDTVTNVEVPVISIGNLTTGGTGKSPMVIWVCQQLRSINVPVAVVSRGYGGQRDDAGTRPNDEALEMQLRLPAVPQLQDPDRIKSANIAINELEMQCIVMDDGFQHRRLKRDLDVVLIDATNPFGYGYLLPRGLLREPLSSLNRADVVVVTRCQQVQPSTIEQILSTIRQTTAKRPKPPIICQTVTAPQCWIQFDGQTVEVANFGSAPVIACCAIGNPDSFIKTATSAGANIQGKKFFADHHAFTRQDIESMVALAREHGADRIICTHKDLVKIAINELHGVKFYALQIEVQFTAGEAAFLEKVQKVVSTVSL